ncbi:uncharacterized protein LOC135114908 isoform X3 [Scylla paramamosain]|uniref:uncharacterized protein LOC135114908 isoform X3 n=1 Tax=Scylla paramamosain TaxID=85552 RepID=UPI00308346E6
MIPVPVVVILRVNSGPRERRRPTEGTWGRRGRGSRGRGRFTRLRHGCRTAIRRTKPHEESRMESQPQQAVSSNDTLVLVGRRASPINSLEREHLNKLVRNEIILANESTDGKVMAMKKLAWERVALHFNAAGYCEKRTVYQLQKVWERIKGKHIN